MVEVELAFVLIARKPLGHDDGHLGVATDLYLYAPLGPGSQKGLNFLFEHTPNHTWKPYDFNLALMDANHRVCEELEITDLTLHDVQNTMCEYSKYVKAICGDGNPKSTYQPETSY